MSDVSKINLNGSDLDIKDATARDEIDTLENNNVEVTDIDDTDQMLLTYTSSAKSFRKFSWSNLVSSMKKKFVDWLFDDLETENKTMIGAVNELNSNSLNYKGVLTEDDDLDDIKTTGIYYFTADSMPKNSPLNYACVLEVSYAERGIIQKLYRYGTAGYFYFRPYSIASESWYNWTEIDATLCMRYRGTATNIDPDDLYAQDNIGFYYYNNSSLSPNAWGILAVFGSSSYTTQLWMGLAANTGLKYRYWGGNPASWSDWKTVSFTS